MKREEVENQTKQIHKNIYKKCSIYEKIYLGIVSIVGHCVCVSVCVCILCVCVCVYVCLCVCVGGWRPASCHPQPVHYTNPTAGSWGMAVIN